MMSPHSTKHITTARIYDGTYVYTYEANISNYRLKTYTETVVYCSSISSIFYSGAVSLAIRILSLLLCLSLCVHVPLLWIFVKLRLPISSSSNSISYSRAFGLLFVQFFSIKTKFSYNFFFMVWTQTFQPSISEIPTHQKIFMQEGKKKNRIVKLSTFINTMQIHAIMIISLQ